ncbi:MAG: hypothetical protein GQE15_04175 [Archangiaceae bacterium]|nr:hypothetical protein [Archangiaceae bacterium]
MTPSLEAAAADVKADERARALEHLLGVWRAAPHPDVADRIVSLGATLPCDVDKKRWLEVAAKRRSADLSGLLAIGLDAPSATLRERVDQLATWPADPRIDRFLAHAYANPPYTSTGARPFWTGVVALAAKVQDVDALEAMKACRTQWSTTVPWQEFLRGHVDRVVKQAKVPGARALTPAQTAALAAIDAQLAAAGQKPRAVRSAEELERAIFEAPHDESLRRVLMDTLLEQNHPRGALLALHTAAAGRELTAAEKKAEKALLQQHRAVLLGELEPVLKPDVSFAMGFVSRAALKQGSSNALKLAISKSVGLPAWATVQHLEGPGDDEVIAHPVMRSLVSSAASSAELRVLAAMPSLTDVELTLRGFADTFAASLQRLPARPFPALKRLRLMMDSLDHASAFCARVKLPRLERLVVEGELLRGWMHSDEGVRRELKATAKAFVKHLLAVRADETVLRVLYANDPRDVAADIVIRDRKATVVVAKSTRESPPRAVQTWDQIGEREVGQALEALVALGVPVTLSTHPKRPCDAAVFEALEARL